MVWKCILMGIMDNNMLSSPKKIKTYRDQM